MEPLDMLVQGSDGHRERFMITGICCGRTPVGAAWRGGVLLVGAGPVGLHTGCASPETHLRENVSSRLKRAVANCEPPTEQPTHWAITDPCTRPRNRPRSAITRRTPRLRLAMRSAADSALTWVPAACIRRSSRPLSAPCRCLPRLRMTVMVSGAILEARLAKQGCTLANDDVLAACPVPFRAARQRRAAQSGRLRLRSDT